MRFFCISIYCVYVVSLHTESTDSVIDSTESMIHQIVSGLCSSLGLSKSGGSILSGLFRPPDLKLISIRLICVLFVCAMPHGSRIQSIQFNVTGGAARKFSRNRSP